MIKKSNEMKLVERPNIRNGNGVIRCQNLLEKEEMYGGFKYVSIMKFAPGDSIGDHQHLDDVEIYYVLEGRFSADDNGTPVVLEKGDVMITGNGESHSIKNIYDGESALSVVIIMRNQ